MRPAPLGLGIAVLCCLAAGPADAQEVDWMALPDATDNDYGIDLYLGPALGSGRIVGMGGAAVAMAEGSAGVLYNPAAPAVRSATSRDKWDWDWHIDWLSPQIGSDFDNNGITADEDATPFVTGGVVGNYKQWALGVSLSYFLQEAGDISPQFVIGQVSLARTFMKAQLAAGASIRSGTFTVFDDDEELFAMTGSSLELGAVWKPKWIDIRVGSAVSFPVVGERITTDNPSCQPTNCFGYVLPDRVLVPWKVAGGIAWRRGPTRWNRKVAGDFRDEKSVTVTGDLVVTGAVDDGYGVEAFARGKLQPSGRRAVLSFRGGAEYEWVPGRFRIRGGSYWEPGRFQDEMGETVGGRLHITLGLDLRVYSFRLWGDPYRVRISLISDGAERYFNGGLSVGFWH